MAEINRKKFYEYARKAPLGNRLTQEQVTGMGAIIAHWETYFGDDIRHLAYILATAFHETAGRFAAIREGSSASRTLSDAQARKVVAGYKYGKPDATSTGKPLGRPTGHVYYGRGLVQLTWKDNYDRMGSFIGLDLVNYPERLLDLDTSVKVLFEGMFLGASKDGDFTGKALEDYFNDKVDDPVGARRIINGTDKAKLIASYHYAFLDALKAAQEVPKSNTPEAPVKTDGANLLLDKTVIGTVATGVAGGAGTLLGAISNPWAFGAFAVLAVIAAVGTYLAITGRIQIKKQVGA